MGRRRTTDVSRTTLRGRRTRFHCVDMAWLDSRRHSGYRGRSLAPRAGLLPTALVAAMGEGRWRTSYAVQPLTLASRSISRRRIIGGVGSDPKTEDDPGTQESSENGAKWSHAIVDGLVCARDTGSQLVRYLLGEHCAMLMSSQSTATAARNSPAPSSTAATSVLPRAAGRAASTAGRRTTRTRRPGRARAVARLVRRWLLL